MVCCLDGSEYCIEVDFIFDVFGFVWLLSWLLQLELLFNFLVCGVIFCYVCDNILVEVDFDCNKILIIIYFEYIDVWYWMILFFNGCCLLGVVVELLFFECYEGDDLQKLQVIVGEDFNLIGLLVNVEWVVLLVCCIIGYLVNVSLLWGFGYVLLGNVGEFFDLVFFFGVIIVFKFVQLVSECFKCCYVGQVVDWEVEFLILLCVGVKIFWCFVESWYEGGFQKIIYYL